MRREELTQAEKQKRLSAVKSTGPGSRIYHFARRPVADGLGHTYQGTVLCGHRPPPHIAWHEHEGKLATCQKCIERLAPSERAALYPSTFGRMTA